MKSNNSANSAQLSYASQLELSLAMCGTLSDRSRALRDHLLLFGTGTGTQPFPVLLMGRDRYWEHLGLISGTGTGLE